MSRLHHTSILLVSSVLLGVSSLAFSAADVMEKQAGNTAQQTGAIQDNVMEKSASMGEKIEHKAHMIQDDVMEKQRGNTTQSGGTVFGHPPTDKVMPEVAQPAVTDTVMPQ